MKWDSPMTSEEPPTDRIQPLFLIKRTLMTAKSVRGLLELQTASLYSVAGPPRSVYCPQHLSKIIRCGGRRRDFPP